MTTSGITSGPLFVLVLIVEIKQESAAVERQRVRKPYIHLLKDVPLYNDVMLPSTDDKLVLPLSPLPPSEPLDVSSTNSEDSKSESYAPAQSTTTTSHRPPAVKLTYYFVVNIRH